jgi:hypothetical protein
VDLWQFLLSADRDDFDLSDPANGLKWLSSRPWAAAGDWWWTATAQSNWTRNVRALRRLARRLKPLHVKRGASPDPKADRNVVNALAEQEADTVLEEQLDLLRMVPVRVTLLPLNRDSYRGVAMVPTVRSRKDGTRKRVDPHPALYWKDDLSVFWQVVFLSFVQGGSHVCEECGERLPEMTPTGRPSKQRRCGRCRVRICWTNKTPEEKREKWREDNQRKKGN